MTTEEDELINKLREKITKVAQKLGQVYIQQTQSFLETLDLLQDCVSDLEKFPTIHVNPQLIQFLFFQTFPLLFQSKLDIFQEEILSVITSFLVFLQKISYSQFLIFLKDFHTFFKESVNFWDSVVSNEQQKPQFTQFIILIKEQNLDFLINDESFTLNSFSYFGSSLSQKIKLPVRSLFDIQLIQIVITKLLIKLIKSSFYVFQENFDFVTFLVSQIKHSTLKLKIISLECLNHFIRGKASSINHRQLASTLFTFLSQGKTDQERHLLNQLRTPEFEIHLGNCLLSLFETKNASRWSVYACFQNFESLFTWNILNSVTNHLKIVFTKILKEIVSNFPQTTFLVKALFPVLHLEIIQNEIAEIFHICISRLVDSEIFQISLNNNNNNENKNSGLFKSLQNEKNQKANKQKQNIENHIHFMDKENLKISNILNQFLSAIQKILNLIHNQNETIQIPSSQFGCLISTTKIILQILIGNQDKLRSLIISKVQKLDDLFSRILKEIVPQIVKLAKTQEMQILFEEQNVEKILDLLEVVQQTNLENSRGFLLEMADWIDEKMIEKNQQIVRKCVMLVKEIVLDKREDVEIISKFILDNLVDEGNEEQTRVECLRAIPKVIGNIANQIENYNFMDNFVSPFRDILEKEKSQMILEELAKLIEIMVRKTNGQWNGRIFEKKNENGVSIRPFSLFPNKMRIQYATNIRSSLQKIVPDFTKKMSIEEQETSLLRRCRIFSRFFMDRDDPRFTTKTQVYSLRAFLCLLSNSESKELEEEKQFVEDLFGLLFGENEFLRMEIAKSLYIFVKSQVLTNLDIPEPQNISVQKRIPQTIYDTKIQKLLDHLIEEKLVNSDEPIQEAILVALGSLGSFVEKEFLKQIMIVLVDRLTKPHPISQQFLSFDQIRIISKRMGITESQLFILFKYDLCPLVMRKLKTSDSLVNEIASAIFDGTSQEFIEKYHQYSLPEILINKDVDLLSLISQRLEKEPNMLFRDNLSYIISFFLIQNPSISQKKKEMHSKQIQKLQEKFKEFEIPISNLESLITDFLPVFVEYLGDEVNAIQYKAELALSYCCQQSIPKLGLSSFLKKHFLRIVSHLTMKFHDKDVDISEKRRSMRSLSKLIQAVGGNNIGTLWPRIITILEEVNEIEALKLETLKLLSVFITTIDDKALKSLGYWVIAFLYNSFNREMKSKYKQSEPNSTISTNNIFHVGINSHNENIIDNSTQTNQNQQYIHSMLTKLIITKESLLRDKFRLIPILFRDNPLFHDINKKIEENSQKIDLDQYLSELNQKLNQPSSMERFLALKKLIQILKSKKQEIYSLIIQGESQTTIKKISDLVQSLLLGSNARGAEERLLYTKCLGLIGAIDPGVLPLRVTDSLKRHERRGKGLIFELINNYLINALQKKHDFAGFAIQELLAYLRNYHKHSMSKLSEHFGIETQELISEFHNSKYHMDMQSVTFKSKNDHSNSRQSIFQKIFSDSRDNKFHRWIGSWAFYLVSKTSEQESEIFRACQGVIKNDEAIALYLLPYLIQNIIFSQISKETNEMLDEIQDILRHANSDVFLLNRSTVEYEMVQLGLQTVFTIVDTLFEWNEARKKKSRQNRVSRKSKNSNQQNENTQNFLNSIPLEKLAYASFNFKAYARAIKYHELFTRKQMELMVAEITKKQFLAKQTPFLQKMYSAIEDPDSLDGIRTLRTSITATEKILDFETEGNWLDSMRIYDQAIQQIHEQKNQHYQQQNQQKQPHQQEQQAQTTSNTTESKLETQTDSPMANIVELNIGLLNSMSNLNLYHPLKSRIFDILNNNQFNEKDLMKFNSFGVRVGCESGDWKLAEHFLNAKCEYDFFVDLGNILLEIFHLSQKYHESLTRTRNDSTHSHLKTIPIENNTIDDNSGISDIMMSEGLNEGNETGIGANSQNDSMGLENTQSQEKLHALFGYSENSMRVVRIKELLNKARLNLMSSLSAAGMESYQRAYPYVVNLHILYEVEQMFRLWNKGFPAETHNMRKRKIFETFQQQQQNHMRKDNLVNELDKRLEICANSFRAMEPIFKTRRIVFELCQMKDEVARTWLQVARTSRKANQIDRTKSAIIHAENFHLPELYVEKAKLLFTSGNPRQALFTLEEAVNKSRAISDVSVSQLLKIQLLHNKWAADTGLKSSREVVEKYKSILVAFPRTSKAYFYLASHYDATLIARLEKYQEYLLAGNNVFTTAQKSSIRANKLSKSKSKLKVKSKAKSKTKSKKESEDLQNSLFSDPREGINLDDTLLLLKNAIRNYASSLQYSDKYIFECLPRILSLWFGLGATTTSDRSKGGDQICLLLQIFSTEKPSKQALEEWISKINKLMTKLARDLPSYKWVTAQSQLVSRICHTNPSVWVVLKDILSVVFRAYPHHSIWSMIAMHRSVVEQRKHRVAELFNSFKQYPQIDRKIQQVSQLTDLLIRVSHEKSTPLVQRYMEKMHALGELDLVVPRQDTLGLNFPGLQTENSNNSNNSKNSNNSNNSKNSNNSNNSNNFSNHNIPTIKKVCKKFEQLSSLQKPKKLKFLGSNGVHYTFLVKPHDDLRKDARMMDFMNLITRILKKNPQSRQRRLETRTYAVIPLNEKCGIIEWVENTKTFRSIVMSLYQGKNPSLQELQKIYRFQDFTNENTFTNILVPLFPPVFYRWFLLAFPDPALWFDARLTFTRSLAVMSMVGYATGLGDRHTENILLNSKTGEAVHVDFNCLFEQGSALKIPECVPFRLTHNLINAMGLSGYEGVFRRVCEITMSIFRRNQKALINVLETFVYDPLVEWTKNQQNQQENESGVRTLKRINERLQGRENAGVAWSVEGQVDLLISNATSPNNLARMFIGWMPFL